MERREPYFSAADRIRALKEERKYSEAEEEIGNELRKNPDQPFLKASLADLYLRQNRLAEGRILAEEILAGDPQQAEALSVLGDVFFKQNSPRKALDYYRQALSRHPRDYLFLKTARALRKLKRFEEALEELERVLVVKPKSFPFLREKASLLNQMKEFDRALAVFEKMKEVSPEDEFVQKEILRLKSMSRPAQEVVKELRIVAGMESKKNDPQVHGLLAQKLKAAGFIHEAAAEYRTASELAPDDLFFLKQEGFCHYRAKEYEEAIRCLADAFRKDPADSVVRKTLGIIFKARGETVKFLELLEEALRQHPGEKTLWGVVRKLRGELNRESSEAR